jgi:cell wall-associated NlpC family hydrolase
VQLNRRNLIDLMEPCFDGKHTYGVGDGTDKPPLGSSPDSWVKSDCSGFVRWILYGAFKITVPDGSANQHQWCEKKALKEVKYSAVGPLSDSVLRIAFIAPSSGYGHVWLVCSGETIESHSPNGPSRRPWDTPVLKNNCTACFELGPLV